MAKHWLWAAASLTLSLTATGAQAAPDLNAANARLTALLDKNYPALEAIYKDIHANPELGMQEVRTAGILAKHLRAAGSSVSTAYLPFTTAPVTLVFSLNSMPCFLKMRLASLRTSASMPGRI